jgi:two-component system, chemotaxis family, chemotaxis protein CheY
MNFLVIEDEMTALIKMKAMLSAYGQGTGVTNGYQALEQCAEAIKKGKPFDLIAIDIGLPKVSGLQVLQAINKLEKDHQIPPSKKIMVTASGTKDNLIKAASSGCDGFMVKPVKKDTLEEKMAAWGFEKKPEPIQNP